MSKATSYLQRIKRLGIVIPVWGYGDEERLARVVYRTWNELPLADRRFLKAYWRRVNASREHGMSTMVKHPLLIIELSETWAGRARNVVGEALLSGNTIRVLDAAFRRMPDEVAMVLIAHELMHILRDATEQSVDDIDFEEELTRADVENRWGYPEEDLSDWLESNLVDIELHLEILNEQ